MSSSPPTIPPPRGTPRPNESEGGGILARGWVVRTVIVVTLLLTMGMVAAIYVRWLTVQEPTATIVVAGDASLDGAQILVTGGPNGPVAATLDIDNEFTTPIHLQPGQYHMLIKMSDQPVFDGDVRADRLQTAVYPLPTLLTVTGQPADEGANAKLTSADGSINGQDLDRDNNYSVSWRVAVGAYHLTVVHNGITLYDNPALAIGMHAPLTIDLAQPRRGRD